MFPQAKLRGHKLQKVELTVSSKIIKLVDVNGKVSKRGMREEGGGEGGGGGFGGRGKGGGRSEGRGGEGDIRSRECVYSMYKLEEEEELEEVEENYYM